MCTINCKLYAHVNLKCGDINLKHVNLKCGDVNLKHVNFPLFPILNIKRILGVERTFLSLVIVSYGMLMPIDRKSKMMYVIYRDELARRAGAPEYMSPTALTRLVHKDSSQNNLLVRIVKNMGIEQKHQNQAERCSSFSNFIEGKFVHEHKITYSNKQCIYMWTWNGCCQNTVP